MSEIPAVTWPQALVAVVAIAAATFLLYCLLFKE